MSIIARIAQLQRDLKELEIIQGEDKIDFNFFKDSFSWMISFDYNDRGDGYNQNRATFITNAFYQEFPKFAKSCKVQYYEPDFEHETESSKAHGCQYLRLMVTEFYIDE